jgi:TatD DNase family protein
VIDTHCHLYYPDFKDDLPEVIARAQQAGVEKIITVAVDRDTAEQCLNLCSQFPGIVACAIGVHPSEVGKVTEEDLLWIEAMCGDPAVVAVGEIGLDIYRGETNIDKQIVLFERMLQLANHAGLPAIIHHRAAGLKTIEIVEKMKCTRGVFHCFSEDLDYATCILEQGLHISFTGNITYKNSKLPDLAKQIPLERVMLETDAPFMAPVPFRGQRCEPRHVKEIAEKLAEIHQTSFETIARTTTTTAKNLFFP